MRPGDRVEVRGRGTTFIGARGVIVSHAFVAHEAGCMVLLDGERLPLYFGRSSLIPVDEASSQHLAGAE